MKTKEQVLERIKQVCDFMPDSRFKDGYREALMWVAELKAPLMTGIAVAFSLPKRIGEQKSLNK